MYIYNADTADYSTGAIAALNFDENIFDLEMRIYADKEN